MSALDALGIPLKPSSGSAASPFKAASRRNCISCNACSAGIWECITRKGVGEDDAPDPLTEESPAESRIRFLARWARLQLGLIDMKSFASSAPMERRRLVVDHVISTAAPCAARLRAAAAAGTGVPEQVGKTLTVLVRFLNKDGIAPLIQVTNELSAEQFAEPWGTFDDATEAVLKNWHARVLPTLAALSLLGSDIAAPDAPCCGLITWSGTFLSQHPARRQRALFSSFSMRPPINRSVSVADSFKSCASDSSEDELPPEGAEHELKHSSVSEAEGGPAFQSFLSVRSARSAGGSGILGMFGFSGPVGPESWEFQRGAEEHGWDDVDATQISVRGPTFLSDKVKKPSPPAIFEVVHVDLFDADQEGGYPNVGPVPEGLVSELRRAGEDRFLFVANFCMPPLHLAIAFAVKGSVGRALPAANGDPAKELFRRFVEEMDDKERSQRFKVIPWVREGPWLVQKAVGRTPAIIGKSLKVNYYQSPGDYFEVSIDIFSSSAAQRILGLMKGAAKALTMEVFFVLEGKCSEELPEHILGGFRVSHGDLTRTRGPI